MRIFGTRKEGLSVDAADVRYQQLISDIRRRLAEFCPEHPLVHMLSDPDMQAMVDRLSEAERPELYRRSHFIGPILWGIAKIQYRTSWARTRHDQMNMYADDTRADFAAMLNSTEPDELLAAGGWNREPRMDLFAAVGTAVVVLAEDPDVDLKVARDLGYGDGYPHRAALPAAASGVEFFGAATARVATFWRHVLPVPLPGFLAASTEIAASTGIDGEPTTSDPLEVVEKARDAVRNRMLHEMTKVGGIVPVLRGLGDVGAKSVTDGLVDYPIWVIIKLIEEASGLPDGPCRNAALARARTSTREASSRILGDDLRAVGQELLADPARLEEYVTALTDAAIAGFVDPLVPGGHLSSSG